MDRGIQEGETDLTDHDPLANIQALSIFRQLT